MEKESKEEAKRIFGEITLSILDIICSIPGALVGSFIDQKTILRRMNISKEYKSLPANYLNGLIQRGYLEVKTENGQKSVRLTHKGKIRQLEGNKNDKKDGKWRFLSFDIPETRSRDRDQFRRSIKRIGFCQVQKSLWVCPFVRADQIDLIIDGLKIRQYVAYIISDKTDIEDYLNGIFKK